jgi:CheY-like chemotaxis protein
VHLEFRVQDTGIGIPREKQQEVFEAFSQADASTTRRYGGTGLGLSICRRLFPLLGGEIGLESELGKGTTVCLVVPFRPAPGRGRHLIQSAPAANPRLQRPLHILVADDHPVNQKLVQAMHRQQGHTVVLTSNGLEALAADPTDQFDLILMDVQMPDMDGSEASRGIRAGEAASGGQSRRTPIVALTAHAMASERER